MTKRSLLRPAFLSLALLGVLTFASPAAQDDPPTDPAKASSKSETPDAAKGADAEGEADGKEAAKPRDFSGKYMANGQSNGGRKYKALVEILREGDVYQVIWVLGPSEGYMGIGIVDGDALSVGWSIGEVPGVVIYKPDPAPDSKKLVGRWTAPGSRGQTFTETLTPIG